jgi:hypothetical protein
MPATTWNLIADGRNHMREGKQFHINPAEFGVAGQSWHVMSHAREGGLSAGVDLIEIQTGKMMFEVVPTRGMGIRRAIVRGADGLQTIGWKSPTSGPVHPSFVDLGEPSGLGWLDGFDELLARCGLESNGAPEFDDQTGRLKYPLHGRIANKPAHTVHLTVDTDSETIKLQGIVDETRFHFLKLRLTTTITTKFHSTAFTVHDEVENLSALPAEMQLLYHINFGVPLLDGGSRVVAPVKTLVPRNAHAAEGLKAWDSYSAPQAGFEEMVYFFELNSADDGTTRALLKNAHATAGASVIFNNKQLPCFSLWKDTGAVEDGYVTGLEPGTNYPNPRSYEGEQGRVAKLAPGGKQAFEVTVEVHTSEKAVAAAEAAVAKIQSGRQPKIFDQPQPGWCA